MIPTWQTEEYASALFTSVCTRAVAAAKIAVAPPNRTTQILSGIDAERMGETLSNR
jgi:hypothetical protein